MSEDYLEILEKKGIDPFLGECFCFADAIQKIVDPHVKFTEIMCVHKDPFGNIAHCMLFDAIGNFYYDGNGEHDYDDAMLEFRSYVDECYPEDGETFDDDCVEYLNYMDGFVVNKLCTGGKIEIIERVLLETMPGWLKGLKDDIDGRMMCNIEE